MEKNNRSYSPEELDVMRFELEQQVKLKELELKEREIELAIQEQKSKRFSTPLLLSITGGIISIVVGLILSYNENSQILDLEKSKNVEQMKIENKRFQSELFLKTLDSENYLDFSRKLEVLSKYNLIKLDDKTLRYLKRDFIAQKEIERIDSLEQSTTAKHVDIGDQVPVWLIIASTDTNLKGAKYEKERADNLNFKNVTIWKKGKHFSTSIGRFSTEKDALDLLLKVKETFNRTAYITKSTTWCTHPEHEKTYVAEENVEYWDCE